MPAKPRVLIAGGGFAALETAFLLRMRMHDQVDLALVSDGDSFVFRPNTIYVPFGADPDSLLVGLHKPLERRNIDHTLGRVVGVDPAAHEVVLADDTKLGYDKLVIATGAEMSPQEIPGPARARGDDLDGPGDARLRRAFERAAPTRQRAGERRRVPLPRAAEQQVLRAALRDRADARDLAAAQHGARQRSDRLVHLRGRLHPGLRAPAARARRRRSSPSAAIDGPHRARSSPR